MRFKQVARWLLPGAVVDYYRDKRVVARYLRNPVAPPPELLKREIVVAYARRYRTRILVETGTSRGDMVAHCKKSFRTIYSIELDVEIAAGARQRFHADSHVHLLQGDSGKLLSGILARINEPALFWLDGHYSGPGTARGEKDTPLEQELEAIAVHPIKSHVILIDDARDFGTGEYPSLEVLQQKLMAINSQASVELRDDILRSAPFRQ